MTDFLCTKKLPAAESGKATVVVFTAALKSKEVSLKIEATILHCGE
jgi:hypothetical protein